MFAVIKTGGKQYRVASGDELTIEKLAADAGETVQFNDVLMLGGDTVVVGDPMIDGAAVQAEILTQGKGPKLLNLKRRRRKHSSRRLKGHRQQLTTVKVTDILASGGADTGIKAAIGAGSVVSVAAVSASAPAASAPQADAPAVESTRPDNLLTEAQGTADDLTKISGVGPKLNDKLNENGVFHFWQVAEWGPNEIAFMDDQLSFKGRIERDNWIAQATELAKGGDAE